MAVHEVGKPAYKKLAELEHGEVLIGTFSLDRDGLLGIQFDRGYTASLSDSESDRLVEALRQYLAGERTRES
jgi:hypothetical protein